MAQKQTISFKDLRPNIDESLQLLKKADSFSTIEANKALMVIGRSGQYDTCPCDDQRALGMHLVYHEFSKLFARIWNDLRDFLRKDLWGQQGYKNLTLIARIGENLTNQCPAELGAEFGKQGCIPLLLEGLKKLKPYFEQDNSDALKINYLARSLFSCLHNSIRQCNSNREIYRKAGVVDFLKSLMQSNQVWVRVFFLLPLAYAVNESERDLLSSASEGAVENLVKLLQAAVKTDTHEAVSEEFGGRSSESASTPIHFSALELLDCLNHLAINDDIKRKIKMLGGIPAILRMLQDGFSEEEQTVATEALWNLTFEQSIGRSGQLQASIPFLEKLRKSTNRSLRNASEYALWQIKGSRHDITPAREGLSPVPGLPQEPPPTYEESMKEPDQALASNTGRLMISYQWDSKPTARKIRDGLVSNGYRVWMDETDIKGNILAAMAEAVEKSDIILIFMSERYKDSQSCRSEAGYAYSLEKKVIPILVEDGYKPDGWLGPLLGMKLYYKCCSNAQIESQMESLLNAVKACIVSGTDNQDNGSNTSTPTPPSPAKSSVCNWTESDVQDWLKKSKLDDLCEVLDSFDGDHLKALYNDYQENPKKFEDEMKTDYHMNSRIYLKFRVALGKLFK